MTIDHERDENYLSSSMEDTDEEWTYLLSLCEKKKSIGFGELDSFLSGPDIEKRVSLVEEEIKTNKWLRIELKDTLLLNQTKDIPKSQYNRLSKVLKIYEV